MAIEAIVKSRRSRYYEQKVRIIISELCGEIGVINLERFCDNFESEIKKIPRRSWCHALDNFKLVKIERDYKIVKVEVWHLNSKNEHDRLIAVIIYPRVQLEIPFKNPLNEA